MLDDIKNTTNVLHPVQNAFSPFKETCAGYHRSDKVVCRTNKFTGNSDSNLCPKFNFSSVISNLGECVLVGGNSLADSCEMDKRKRSSIRGITDIGQTKNDAGEGGSRGYNTDGNYKDLNRNLGNNLVSNLTSNTDKKTEMTALYHLFSEDMRISKILRRLSIENNSAAAIELCEKLQTAVMDASNASYIRRAFDFLAESIISILEQGPIDSLYHVAKVFGMLGYVIRLDFPIYKNWIIKSYDSIKEIRIYLMHALKITLKYDSDTLDLMIYSDRLIVALKDMLESADVSDHFIAVSDTIGVYAKNYKKAFEKHFTDIVDIVVGWHLEVEQPMELKQHCSNILQQFSEFFMKKIDFTLGLLGQFLEDIVAAEEDIELLASRKPGKNTYIPETNVGSFIGAFNSVLKCLTNDSEVVAFKLEKPFFENSIKTITQVAHKTLRVTTCNETVQSINEFFIIIQNNSSYYGNPEILCNEDELIQIIKLELEHLINFDDVQTSSFLFLLLTFVRRLKANIPVEFVSFLFKPTHKGMCKLKFSTNQKHFNGLVKLYQEILSIKNVPMLQEAYKQILVDVRQAMETMLQKNDYYTLQEAECVLNFYLSAISILATQTSSIIGMYALQPTILELLIKDFHAADTKLWSRSQSLHDAIVTILSVHCIKNHNYILSSKILMGNLFSKLSLDDISPSSENFSMIIRFHVEVLQRPDLLSAKTLITILHWIRLIYLQSAQHIDILNNHQQFVEMGKEVCIVSLVETREVVLECAECIHAIVNIAQISGEILMTVAEVSCIHMSSTNSQIREIYCEIFAQLPLEFSLRQATNCTGLYKARNFKLSELQNSYVSSTTSAVFREKYFKNFIEKIAVEESSEFIAFYLKTIFTKCWTAQRGKISEFYINGLSDLTYLTFWGQWEAAQYCVNNKLRTFLGKPQDTFLRIEAVIKEDARILALKEYSKVKDISSLTSNQRNTRILLGFIECLEKAIYNAAEGTAFAIPPPEKPARTFFRVNTSTCNEWFNRIRTAVDLVALHCMEPEMVIRYSEVMLQNLVSSGRTTDIVFEHTIMSYVWALLKNNESEALQGLYVWIKSVSGKRMAWIRHASDHAAGHREKAAEGYQLVISSEEEQVDKHIKEFLTDQLIDCLYYTGQWSTLKEMHAKGKNDDLERVTIPMMALTAQQIDDFIKIETSESNAELRLADWSTLTDLENLSSNLSYYKTLSLTENTLASLALSEDELSESKIKACSQIIHSGMQECARTHSKEHFDNLIVLSHIVHKLNQSTGSNKLELSSLNVDKKVGSVTLTKIMRWADLLKRRSVTNQAANVNLILGVASMARKDGNYKYCKWALEKFFKQHKLSINACDNNDLYKICASIIEKTPDNTLWAPDFLQGVCETSKWLSTQNNKLDDAIQLAASSCIMAMLNQSVNSVAERGARTLLTLSEWLPQSSQNVLFTEEETPMKKLLLQLPEIQAYPDESIQVVIPAADVAVGKCIQYSVKLCPSLAKAWATMGNWFYRWGRKIVEARTETSSEKAGLHCSDIEAIKNLIPEADEDDIEKIVTVLNEHHVFAEDEEIGPNDITSTELIENQLRDLKILKNVDSIILSFIIEIWRQANKSVYGYYELAAHAYFKYLNLACSDNEINTEDCEFNGGSSIVTATLRLLRLVVKHALGLQEVIEEGLTATPTHPWKVIIPQLFSRLNHHEPYVRKRVSELLCRVAKNSPHLIIFPAVVGAAQEEKNDNILNLSSPCSQEISESNIINPLTFCFNSLLDTLSKQTPETVEQVQLLVRELKRVTLLWDEFWLHALAQLYSEYAELFNALEAEVRNMPEGKIPLLTEKHRLLMEFVIGDINRFYLITSRSPETNFERAFQEKYSKIIENTIAELKKPLNLEKPNESWQKIKMLYALFQQKMQKNSHATLKMADISPILATMKNTAISMPGVETNHNMPIYIKSVDNTVYILPTKTKPKKLAFFGSDGKRYNYLFKGLEDLHLDERIMQFLSISNSMMSKSNNCRQKGSVYRAHHYSVIPLGPRSGLISWVDGVTPIFALYKKWQQREAANPKKDKQFTVMRPSEMFYKKLTPLLAEYDLKTTDSRKNWPIPVLRKVLEELTNETPKDLLAKELWCQSSNAAAWRRAIRMYSLSVAVMSVIGYVIGLGDRHLDNVLVKLSTGDILHIDYNVCFEKGKTLRVPEKVPFRMTPNLEEALGVTGIEGTFRLACEHVLKTLRKERETLLTLLEAFVYDPLVDWAMSDDGTTTNIRTTKAVAAAAEIAALGASTITSDVNALATNPDRKQPRKKMENEVIRNTLSSRFAEIKPDWTQYRNDINELLTQMIELIDKLDSQRRQLKEDESRRDLISKQLAMIRELETLGTAMTSHPLNTISQRYIMYKKSLDDYNNIRSVLLALQSEFHLNYNSYIQVITTANKGFVMSLHSELEAVCQLNAGNEFDLVKEFLENSAQGPMYIQADQARKEMDASFIQQSTIVKCALDSLDEYINIIQFYPHSEMENHRFVKYEDWCKKCLENTNSSALVLHEFNEFLQNEERCERCRNAVLYAYELEKRWLDANLNVQKVVELFNNQFLPGIEPSLEIAQEDVSIFLRIQSDSDFAMRSSLCFNLCEIVENHLQFEENYLATSEQQIRPDLNWILDEEGIFISTLIGAIDVVFGDVEESANLTLCMSALQAIHNLINSFQELDSFFHLEGASNIASIFALQDPEVIKFVDEIIDIQNHSDTQIGLEKLQRNNDVQYEFARLLKKLNDLLQNLQNGKYKNLFEMTDRLFQQICTNLKASVEAVKKLADSTLEHERNFSPMDHFSRATMMAANMFECYSPVKFDQYFAIKKILTISQVCSEGKKMMHSLLNNNLEHIYDPKAIHAPIITFIEEFQSRTVAGVLSITAAILEVKMKSLVINMDHQENEIEFIHNRLSKPIIVQTGAPFHASTSISMAQGLCHNLIFAIKQNTLCNHLKRSIATNTAVLQHLRSVSTAHAWLNERTLATEHHLGHILNKAVFLQKIQGITQSLTAWKISIEKIKEELYAFTTAVNQRLKWAVGANQSLIPLQQSFNTCVALQEEKFKTHSRIASTVLPNCTAILAFENIRSNPSEIARNDERVSLILKEYLKAFSAYHAAGNTITAVEEAIVELLDPEGPVDHFWINNVSGLLDDMTDNIQREIDRKEKDLISIQDNLQMSAHKLRSLMDSEIRVDMRYLLKLIMKIDGRHKIFQNNYKQCFNHLSDLHVKVLSKDFTEDNVFDIRDVIARILLELDEIYLDFPQVVTDKNGHDESFNDRRDRSTSKLTGTPVKDGRKEQKRNAYAVSVWRRIRMKLEGRDPDPNRRLTAAEQVDWMIREAMNPDNLAVLYEGWTPWV